ncbi:MAG: hypothetical protein ABI434_18845 [Burkholderiaceae bacterium]
MEPWNIRSNNRQQFAISLICLFAGAALAFTLYDYGPSGSNRQAGFLFGVVLLALGGATLAAGGRQLVVVDAQLHQIRIEDHRLFGKRQHTIAIADIRDIQVACLQTHAKHALRYFLQLTFDGGRSYALFAPQRDYPGASNPLIVAGWKDRLDKLRGVPAFAAPAPPSPAA